MVDYDNGKVAFFDGKPDNDGDDDGMGGCKGVSKLLQIKFLFPVFDTILLLISDKIFDLIFSETFNTIFSKSTIDISRLIWTTTCWEVLQHGQERVHGLETVYLPFASSFMILRITSQPAVVIWSRGHWLKGRPVILINAIVLFRNILY